MTGYIWLEKIKLKMPLKISFKVKKYCHVTIQNLIYHNREDSYY